MLTITTAQVTPAITALFDFTKPTMPRAFNVLEGAAQGQIFTDDAKQPTWAVVRGSIYGTLYLGGQFTPQLLATVVDHFREQGEVGIGCWRDDPINTMLPPNANYDGSTLYFTDRSPSVVLSPSLPELPSGYTLVSRDERLFRSSFDYESTLASFGSVENVMRLTLGLVVLHGEEVACEAATGAATQGHIEVGITTAEAYRQRGFATIACARLIEICEQQGYTTWWDCAKQNSASTRLARKLGYQNEREYRYVWWSKR